MSPEQLQDILWLADLPAVKKSDTREAVTQVKGSCADLHVTLHETSSANFLIKLM
jgi:hypothetical protein